MTSDQQGPDHTEAGSSGDEVPFGSAPHAAAEEQLSKLWHRFDAAAKKHRSGRWKWLTGTVILALAALGIVTDVEISISEAGVSMTVSETIQFVIAKLMEFILICLVVLWCNRHYREHRHQELFYRDRQMALLSYDTFVRIAADPETKNAVLIRCSEAISRPIGSDSR